MSRADELKVLTDSIERLSAMEPPLHLPYSSQSSWYYDQRKRTDALQTEITKLLSQPEQVAELDPQVHSTTATPNSQVIVNGQHIR